ncbi:TPA: hypothetical protein PPE16_004375 [Escherichia coli]|nr:hypothetical protein [Escherichia coli]
MAGQSGVKSGDDKGGAGGRAMSIVRAVISWAIVAGETGAQCAVRNADCAQKM